MKTLQSNSGGAATEENEMPLFTVVKDGHGVDIRIANLDHPSWAPSKGIITFEALKSQKRSNKGVSIKKQDDKSTGYAFGIYLGIDHLAKEIRWERILMKETESFDLSNRKERQRYIVISRHSSVEGSPNQFGRAQYRVLDQEKKATNYLESLKDRKRARIISEELTFEQMIELAPSFGIRPEAHSQNMLTMEILKIAEEQYDKFLKVWDSPDKPGMLVFKRALKAGLIKFDQVNGFTYEGMPLGRTEAAAFAYLTGNVQLLSAIDSITKEVERNSTHTYYPAEHKVVDPVEDLKKQLEEQKRIYEELLAKSNDVPKSTAPTLESKTEKSALVEEAKALGIKGPHLMGEDTLKERIAEIKQQQQ